jgi:CRISPR/Cas system-associated exonuclease Cas4 (RecB family)
MGKIYVALGALALFRHFNPEFRVLVIAPRENIQRKWMKELGNFCRNNVRFGDLRVRSLRGAPARPMVACENLHSFVHEAAVDARRDFFLRLSSFSFGLAADKEAWKAERNRLRQELLWLPDEVFDMRSKELFKDNFARAMCCGLPTFDLVIVDEGHNLKHGFKDHVAARNRVLAFAMGRDREVDSHLFPGYGRRAKSMGTRSL